MARGPEYVGQMPLLMEEQPKALRTSGLRSFVPSLESPQEALDGEARANRQEAALLAWMTPGTRYTPSEIDERAGLGCPLTSVRRALTVLTGKGLLRHHPQDRRQGPYGSRQSTWSLA